MSIVWGPGWYAYTNCAAKFDNEAQEKNYVEGLVANSTSLEVVRYYSSKTGSQVYVKAGRHTSKSEPRVHITLQLGMNRHPWQDAEWPAKTAHVIDIVNPVSLRYPTDVFVGFTADSNKKIEGGS